MISVKGRNHVDKRNLGLKPTISEEQKSSSSTISTRRCQFSNRAALVLEIAMPSFGITTRSVLHLQQY